MSLSLSAVAAADLTLGCWWSRDPLAGGCSAGAQLPLWRPQVLEAFAADDSTFVQNCGRLMAMSSAIVTMPHYEFRNICDTKLESIGRRIACYQEVPAPRGVSTAGCQAWDCTWGILSSVPPSSPALLKQET